MIINITAENFFLMEYDLLSKKNIWTAHTLNTETGKPLKLL